MAVGDPRVFVHRLGAALGDGTAPAQPSEPTTLLADLRTALGMPVMWVAMFISMIGQAATMGVQPILVLHIEAMLGQAASPFLSGFILALPGLALFLTRPAG